MLSLFYWLLAIFLINLGIFIFVLTHERASFNVGWIDPNFCLNVSGFSSRRFSNRRRH